MQIVWTEEALLDVQEIRAFIGRDAPLLAEALTDGIIESIDRLRTFPLSGRPVPEFPGLPYREIVFRNYRIVYIVRGERVFVITVVYSARQLRLDRMPLPRDQSSP